MCTTCMYVCHMCAWCPAGQERVSVRFSGTGYVDHWATVWVLGLQAQPSAKATRAVNCWANSGPTHGVHIHTHLLSVLGYIWSALMALETLTCARCPVLGVFSVLFCVEARKLGSLSNTIGKKRALVLTLGLRLVWNQTTLGTATIHRRAGHAVPVTPHLWDLSPLIYLPSMAVRYKWKNCFKL